MLILHEFRNILKQIIDKWHTLKDTHKVFFMNSGNALPRWWNRLSERASGLSFHLHNGRTTNAFCINSGDLMVANGERDGQINEGNGVCHYIVMTSAANLTKVVFAWPPLWLSWFSQTSPSEFVHPTSIDSTDIATPIKFIKTLKTLTSS